MEDIPQAMIDAANEQGGKLSEVYEVQSGGDTIGYASRSPRAALRQHRDDRRR